MVSLTRVFIGVAVYLIYLLAIIAVFSKQNTVLYIALLLAGSAVFLLSLATRWLTTPGKYRRLMTRGVDATATILAMSDTGVTINKNPYVNLRLRVEPAGRPPYETSVKVLVSRLRIPGVGDTLEVKYDPDKPQDVIVPN